MVIIRRLKRRKEVAELLQLLVDKHPTGTIYVAWDNAKTHEDDEVEAVVSKQRLDVSCYSICRPTARG